MFRRSLTFNLPDEKAATEPAPLTLEFLAWREYDLPRGDPWEFDEKLDEAGRHLESTMGNEIARRIIV